MSDDNLSALKHWIAHDPSDHAQRVRELLRGTLSDLGDAVFRFTRQMERIDHHRRAKRRRRMRNAFR